MTLFITVLNVTCETADNQKLDIRTSCEIKTLVCCMTSRTFILTPKQFQVIYKDIYWK